MKHRHGAGVDRRMTCGYFSRTAKLLAVWLLGAALGGGGAVAAEATSHDTLVYKDGDRVHGRVVSREGNVIVFKSDRFGELRVAAADAVVIVADKPVAAAKAVAPTTPVTAPATPTAGAVAASAAPAKAAAATPVGKSAAEHDEEERVRLWERFSPWVLTARVRQFFGPWHGRLALSTEVVADSTDRENFSADVNFGRKWERNEVQLNARYDYSETNQVPTADMVRVGGYGRHDFNPRRFAHYRPTLELNRANQRAGFPNDYMLLQQELGAGFNVLSKPGRKLRTGVSQNLFDLWNRQAGSEHSSRGVQSAFEEVEWTLPWRMSLAQRGVWYPVRSRDDGWENRVELNKKLTETLSTSLRHEVRKNNPDGSAQDYTRLKVLLGLDF